MQVGAVVSVHVQSWLQVGSGSAVTVTVKVSVFQSYVTVIVLVGTVSVPPPDTLNV